MTPIFECQGIHRGSTAVAGRGDRPLELTVQQAVRTGRTNGPRELGGVNWPGETRRVVVTRVSELHLVSL